jgi:hypothetical protein
VRKTNENENEFESRFISVGRRTRLVCGAIVEQVSKEAQVKTKTNLKAGIIAILIG